MRRSRLHGNVGISSGGIDIRHAPLLALNCADARSGRGIEFLSDSLKKSAPSACGISTGVTTPFSRSS